MLNYIAGVVEAQIKSECAKSKYLSSKICTKVAPPRSLHAYVLSSIVRYIIAQHTLMFSAIHATLNHGLSCVRNFPAALV